MQCNLIISGKTSLIKALTGEQAMEPRDQLFATLDVTAHAGLLPNRTKVLYVDTVGFISDIPTSLIESFAATLEDVSSAVRSSFVLRRFFGRPTINLIKLCCALFIAVHLSTDYYFTEHCVAIHGMLIMMQSQVVMILREAIFVIIIIAYYHQLYLEVRSIQ